MAANNIDLMLEAERRGILPSDKQSLLNEARKRGLVNDGYEQVPPVNEPPQRSDIVSRGLAQNAAQGASFGFSDELTAALAAIPAAVATGTSLKDAFNSILEAERFSQDKYAEEHPVASFAAQVGGGLATGGAGASRIAGAKMFQGAKTIPGALGKKAAASAATGAPIGALYGAGVSEGGLGERAKGAVEGATIAAVASPVLAGAAGAITKTVKGASKIFASRESKDFQQSTKQLARAMIRDEDTPEALLQRASDLGPEATLADVGGTNIKRELERAASMPGSAPDITEKALIGRLSRSGIRVQQVFDRFLGRNNKTATKTLDDISQDAADRAAPLYAKAYETPVDNAQPALQSLLNNPRIQKAIPKAKDRIMSKSSDDNDTLKLLQAELDTTNPNTILWDHVKRQLDDEASAAFRSGENELGKDIAKNARTLRDALDAQNPSYKEARAIWAGSSRAKESFTDGLEFLKGLNNPLTGASEKAARFNELSESEKDLFRKGVSMAIRSVIRSADDTVEGTPPASLLKRIYGNKEKRYILNKVLPTAESRKELTQALRAEQKFRDTTNSILRNSRTELRRQLNAEPTAKLKEFAGTLVNAYYALSGNFFATTRAAGGLIKGKAPTEGVNTQVAKRLVARGNDAIEAALKDVDKYLVLPKETGNAIARFKQVPKGEKIDFLRANPQIKKEIDRTVSALAAGVYASGLVQEDQ
jgi:hypothetical protein